MPRIRHGKDRRSKESSYRFRLLHGQHQSSRLQSERTPKLGDCAIGDFQEMVMGNYQQGLAPTDDPGPPN